MSSLPSATSLPSWRVTAYTWKLLHSSLSFLLFFVPFLLHLSEHEVTKIRLYIQNKKGPIIVYLFSLFPRKVHFKTRWYKICQDPWKASLILLFLLTLNQFCRTISLDPIDLALFPINFKVKFSLTLAGPLLQHLSCIIVNPKHPASVMPSTLKLKYTKTWKVIRVTPKIAVLPFSSRYDLVLQWLPGVSLDNPWLWEVWTPSFWALQQAPELTATRAPAPRKPDFWSHCWGRISQQSYCTEAQISQDFFTHHSWRSHLLIQFTHSPPCCSLCCFFWFQSVKCHTLCVTNVLATLVLIHLPFLPACILLGVTWVVLGRLISCFGRHWGRTSLPRRCSGSGDTAVSSAKDLTAGVGWWKRFTQQKVWSTNSFHMAERMDYVCPGSFYVPSPRQHGVNPGRYLEEPHYSE